VPQAKRAVPTDAALVAQLLDAFNREFDTPSPGVALLTGRLQVMLAGDSLAALLVDDVGIAVVSLRPNPWYDGPVALLDELYVASDRRNQGLGTTLLRAAEAFARACGAEEMEINVESGDVDARRFYERHGYATTGPDQDEPALYYFRSLDLSGA